MDVVLDKSASGGGRSGNERGRRVSRRRRLISRRASQNCPNNAWTPTFLDSSFFPSLLLLPLCRCCCCFCCERVECVGEDNQDNIIAVSPFLADARFHGITVHAQQHEIAPSAIASASLPLWPLAARRYRRRPTTPPCPFGRGSLSQLAPLSSPKRRLFLDRQASSSSLLTLSLS